MPFFQDPPAPPDMYAADRALKTELKRRLPPELLKEQTPRFEEIGRHTTSLLHELSERAEAQPPVHVPWSAFGRRVDDIITSPAWDELKAYSAKHGIVATGYDASLGDKRRVVQCGLAHLFNATSATFSCPLAMTDAAARVLLDLATPALRDKLALRLITDDPSRFITSGQWMTERAGGSDVGSTETVARATGEAGRYALSGTKWFTSATTSEMALTLARIEDGSGAATAGSRGLSLFCVEVERRDDGGLDGILVNRMKDKLGTRALPTAELTLDGLKATLLGEPGRGVASIATMLNITRWHNSMGCASGMAKATFLARDYAERRSAFGKKLSEQPLHRRTLDDMEAESAAALGLCFELADLLGRLEDGKLNDEERSRLRGLIPIAKLTTGKQAVRVASEALECFGGAGYVEDTGLPRLLRDAQVLPIWEGTTNVLSLDVLRAEVKAGSLSALLKDLGQRAAQLPEGLDDKAVAALRGTLGRLVQIVHGLAKAGDAEAIQTEARRVALTCGHLSQAVLLAESTAFAHESDDEARHRFARFTRQQLAGPMG
jgi:acyl-CoA dehydrogenase